MSRLTKKIDGVYYILPEPNFFPYEKNFVGIQKLGKIEDLQEQLGCPLKVVFRALEEGIMFKVKITSSSTEDNFKTEIIEEKQYESIGKISLGYANNKYLFIVPYDKGRYEDKTMIIKLSDYQKTWWLKGEKNNE